MRLILWSEIRASVAASHALGSTPFSLAVDAFAVEDPALAIQREMIGVQRAYAAPLGPRSPFTC